MRDHVGTAVSETRALPISPALAVGLVLVFGGAAWIGGAQGAQHGWLWLVGAGLGFVLHHATFGFAGAFRRLFAEARTAGLRAQLVLLGLGAALFLPTLAAAPSLGIEVRGFVFPFGLATVLGAFVFGIGMQVAAGCVSGTCYAAGAGSPGALLTLAFAVVGATGAALTVDLWGDWPGLPAVSLPASLGTAPALALTLAVLAAAWLLAAAIERRRHGAVQPIGGALGGIVRGPWPLLWGAVGLALLNLATLLLAGRPWGIIAALPLWGSLAVEALGWDDPAFWSWWQEPTRAEWLFNPLLADRTTVMLLALMAGAMLAASLAGRFARRGGLTPGRASGAVLGGLMIGWGGIVAGGCNISAYVSGIASGSLHGWVWIAAALPGNWLVVALGRRPSRA
jgi:uncharacterized membrane protein YedE/YeeE